jgi:hypothetical protein
MVRFCGGPWAGEDHWRSHLPRETDVVEPGEPIPVGEPTGPTFTLIRHHYRRTWFRCEDVSVTVYCHSSLWDGDTLDLEAAMVDFSKPAPIWLDAREYNRRIGSPVAEGA